MQSSAKQKMYGKYVWAGYLCLTNVHYGLMAIFHAQTLWRRADSLQSRLEFLWLSFFTFWSNSRREAGPCQSQGHLTTERRKVSTSERGWKFTCETGMSVAISRYLIYHHMKMHSCMRAHTYTQTRESVAQNRNTRS